MEFTTYVRKPFEVEAVEVTADNIASVAKMIGTLKITKEGVPYIQVDPTKVGQVERVWPGYWMTKMSKNIRCYSPNLFLAQFQPKENGEEPVSEDTEATPEKPMIVSSSSLDD